MAKELKKQDVVHPRTPTNTERRYKLGEIEPTKEEVEKLKEERVVDSALSLTSTNAVQNKVITNALNNKVSVETGKGLSTNDFTDEYKEKIEDNLSSSHSHTNKAILDGISLSDTENWDSAYDSSHSHENKEVLDNISLGDVNNWNNMGGSSSYFLSNYSASGVSILRSNCVLKNDRVCINFVGTCSMNANTTTTLFNLPSALRPFETRDFVAFGQSSNNDGHIGYGYVTETGLLQVRFNQAISSYIRFSFTYDLY